MRALKGSTDALARAKAERVPPCENFARAMAQKLSHHLFTYAEYLALERESGVKHEWCAGQVFA